MKLQLSSLQRKLGRLTQDGGRRQRRLSQNDSGVAEEALEQEISAKLQFILDQLEQQTSSPKNL